MVEVRTIETCLRSIIRDIDLDTAKMFLALLDIAEFKNTQPKPPIHQLGISILNSLYDAKIPSDAVPSYYRYIHQTTTPFGFRISGDIEGEDMRFLETLGERMIEYYTRKYSWK